MKKSDQNSEDRVIIQKLQEENHLLKQEIERIKKELPNTDNNQVTFLKTLYKTIPDLVWIKNKEGVYLSCNTRFEEFFGSTEEEIIGKTDYDFIDKELADFFRGKDKDALNAGKPSVNEEWLTFAKDGYSGLFETIKTPMYDEHNNLIGILGIAHDISSRKKAQEALRSEKEKLEESELFLERIIENIPLMIFVKDAKDLRFIELNKAGENLLGFTREEVIGKNDYDFFPKGQADFFTSKDRAVFDEDRLISIDEEEADTRFGKRILSTKKIAIKDENNNNKYLLGISEDITNKKEIENELKSAIRRTEESEYQLKESQKVAKIGYYVFNILTDEWTSSETLDEIFGIDTKYKRNAEGWLNLVHPTSREEMTNYLMVNILNNRENFDKEYKILNYKNGNEGWVHGKGQLEVDTDGNPVKLFGTIQDITTIKDYEQQLLLAKEKAEESNKLKSTFLANMSHEIRTPMNAIVGFSQFLKDKERSREELDNFANIIINSGNHLLDLINDIIDISKINAGQANVDLKEVDLIKFLTDIFNIFHSQLKSKKNNQVQLLKRFPHNHLHIKTDEKRLRQIIINLLGNALKFTKRGFIEFGYNLRETDILFYVKDTGIGISKRAQKHIFKRFRQGGSSIEQNFGGTGLGLSIAKACTKLLKGEIWCESEEGKGSAFYFNIELDLCESPTDYHTTVDSKFVDFNGEHILIAEDDDISFLYLQEVLKNHNLILHRAKTGQETLDTFIKNKNVSIILMDIQLPLMNGWEVTRELRNKGYNIPIIAQTAYAFEVDRMESLKAGCDDFISKPINPEKLIQLISGYLKNSHHMG